MTKERTILHCDCNGFYASVECLCHPEYRAVPMAVCGDPESRRGIILAKNELAKAYGVQTAETIWQAKKKCPDLVLAPAHHDLYAEYSAWINDIYRRYTELVEPFSIDESWLDVTASRTLFGGGRQIADELRAVVRRETGITISVGVSFNKIFAKMGSDYQKPDATTVITRENYRAVLFPLPVRALLFVGKSTEDTLLKCGIRTIGDLAESAPEYLKRLLGKQGETLHQYANGLDESPVTIEEQEAKSVSHDITFRRNLVGEEDIRIGLSAIADNVAARLRRMELKCSTVQILIKDPNLKSISRQKGLETPTFLAKELAQAGMELIQASWDLRRPIRMLSLAGTNLLPAEQAAEQLSLFGTPAGIDRQREEKLEIAMDGIRERFGKGVIVSARLLKNDIGIDLKKPGKTDPIRKIISPDD